MVRMQKVPGIRNSKFKKEGIRYVAGSRRKRARKEERKGGTRSQGSVEHRKELEFYSK